MAIPKEMVANNRCMHCHNDVEQVTWEAQPTNDPTQKVAVITDRTFLPAFYEPCLPGKRHQTLLEIPM